MNILVTGCTGFVGSHIINSLSGKYNVYCISTSNNCKNKNHIILDLGAKPLENFFDKKIDILIHNAGIFGNNLEFEHLVRNNVYSTKNLLEHSLKNKIRKIIYISSGAVYGYKRDIIKESSKVKPLNYYAISKYYSEKLLSTFFTNTIILRLFFPYGPSQKKGIIPTLASKIINNESISIYNQGNPIINPIYISDLIKIIEFLIKSDQQRRVFNIGGLEKISILDLAKKIGLILNKSPKFAFVKDKSIKNLYCEPSKLYKEKTLLPEVSLEKGLKLFFNLVNNENITFAT